MRIPTDPRIPPVNTPTFVQHLYTLFRDIAKQLNQLSEGRIGAVTNAATAAPTAGTYQWGDTIWNSEPVEAGTGGSRYVITGWKCVAAGSPGTWVEMRCLTGN